MNIFKGVAICLILHFASAKKTISEKSTQEEIATEEARIYCENATGVTESQASEMTMPKNNTIITQGMKCYWECFFKKIGWMDDDGNINEKPINLTPTPCYVKYAFPCLNVTGVDTCDKAANFLNCFNEIYERERSEQGGSCDEDY